MRILLVNLPDDARETRFPLELASLAAVLRRDGCQVDGYDFAAGRRFRPPAPGTHDVVVWMLSDATWPRAQSVLQRIAPGRRPLVVACGPYATLFPEEVLAESCVDLVVLGETERAVGPAVRVWVSGRGGAVPGTVWQSRWQARGLTSDHRRLRIDRLEELPPPDRTVFSVDGYSGMATRRTRYTQVVASRGSGRVSACSPLSRLLPGGWRGRPVDQVVGELAMLRQRHGIDEFHFEDQNLFERPDYVAELARRIRARLPGVLWQCPNGHHPDDLRAELLEELAAAGCYRVYVEPHSPDAAAMRLLRWSWDPEHLGRLARRARQIGIELGAYFTLGLPGESEVEMRATVGFAVDSELAWGQFTPFRFVPGAPLWQRRDELASLIPPPSCLRRVVREAYWRFYGSRRRWQAPLDNLNRRNAVQFFRRAYAKLIDPGLT